MHRILQGRHAGLLAATLVVLLLPPAAGPAAHAAAEAAARAVDAPGRPGAGTGAQARVPTELPARPTASAAAVTDAFVVRSWRPPAVAPAPAVRREVPRQPVPAVVRAPPYAYLGRLDDDGGITVFLDHGGSVLAARPGAALDGGFRLASAEPPVVVHESSGTQFALAAREDSVDAAYTASPAAFLRREPVMLDARAPAAPAGASSLEEIEAAVTAALASPLPAVVVPSAFPLGR